MRIHRKKGFTLIELIVVIAILAILAAILVPTISGFIARANEATDVANAKMLYNAGMMVQTGATITGSPFSSATGSIATYVSAWPTVKASTSGTVGAAFIVTVTDASVSVVAGTGGKTFNQATGKFS